MTIVLATIASVLYLLALWIWFWSLRNMGGSPEIRYVHKNGDRSKIAVRPDMALSVVASLILVATWTVFSWLAILYLAALCGNNAVDGFNNREHDKHDATPKEARVMLYKLIAWAFLCFLLLGASFLAPL